MRDDELIRVRVSTVQRVNLGQVSYNDLAARRPLASLRLDSSKPSAHEPGDVASRIRVCARASGEWPRPENNIRR